jgi:suppressor for copper-sensitivity B
LLAFLGGLILNVMPCVLPVIMMKLRSLTSKEALCGSIVGNYASFAAFAICVAFLKISGETVGWGMHFQNPYFLEATTFLLFFLTLYSFELIPFFPSISIADGKYRAFFSAFLSSVVASVVAIPCTAPFLGTAAAFAIQGSIADLFSVFFAIATGFSTPYFLSFFVPIKFLSKFNRCGGVFKKIINGGAFVAFLWIFWLLSDYMSPTATTLYALTFVALTVLLKTRRYRLVFALLALRLCYRTQLDFSTKTEDSCKELVQLARELEKKRVVIFNITADWCLTCKYNRLKFGDKKVLESFKNNGVKFVEADMTRKNAALTKFINDRGRVGIPFTIIYGPKAPEGILLDEIPTADAIIEAVERAK